MKIILTVEEAQKIAAERIRIALNASFSGTGLSYDVQIGATTHYDGPAPAPLRPLEPEPAPPRRVEHNLVKFIREMESLNYASTQKIAAIKKARETIRGLDLADAKWIVENWADWKLGAIEYGMLPDLAECLNIIDKYRVSF